MGAAVLDSSKLFTGCASSFSRTAPRSAAAILGRRESIVGRLTQARAAVTAAQPRALARSVHTTHRTL